MTMYANVLRVRNNSLLVCDWETCQQVVVFTSNACCFCADDQVCICYNGVMTNSIPPQITATSIKRIDCDC